MSAGNQILDRVLAACERSRERDLADLLQLLAQPSISLQNTGVRERAALVAELLRFGTSGRPMISVRSP